MNGLPLLIRPSEQKFAELSLRDGVALLRGDSPEEFRRLRIDRDSKTVLMHARKPRGAFRIVPPRSELKAAHGLKRVLPHAASFRITDAKIVQGGDVAPVRGEPPQLECARAVRSPAFAGQSERRHSVQGGRAPVARIEFLRFAMPSSEFRAQAAPVV